MSQEVNPGDDHSLPAARDPRFDLSRFVVLNFPDANSNSNSNSNSPPNNAHDANHSSQRLFFLVSLLTRLPSLANLSPQTATSTSRSSVFTACATNRPLLPRWISRRLTFYRLHWAYFITIASLATFCIWLFPKSHRAESSKLHFIDSMYTAVSATCTTGLISVRMQDFSLPDNLLIMFLMILGSPIFTSVLPLYFRQYQFRKNIRELELHISVLRARAAAQEPPPAPESEVEASLESELASAGFCGLHKRGGKAESDDEKEDYTEEQLRVALEATHLEHEAIVLLNWVVSVYLLSCLVIGFLVLEIMFQSSSKAREVLHSNGVNQLFFTVFQTISAFTNSGILILNDNMVPLREFNGILLWSMVLILIGNTMFPPCLRVIIWILKSLSASPRRQVYDYLLKNPRRCFTHLFPRNQTIWLVVTVMAFNALNGIFFYAQTWNSEPLDGLNVSQKLVNGLFQSITTRSAGENVVSIGALSPSMLVFYIAMMYIAVYPIYLSRQNSQASEQLMEEVTRKAKRRRKKKKNGKDFSIATQSKRLIARDSAFLFITIFVLCMIENHRIEDDPLNFSIFNIIFEVISAYGNVGLTLGYSCSLLTKITSNSDITTCRDVPYSFSGKWSIPGKLLMIVIMFLGRHRGLPDNMDSALQIPKSFFSEQQQQQQQHQQEQQQQQHQRQQSQEYIVEIPALELVSTTTASAGGLKVSPEEQQEVKSTRSY